MLSCISLSFCLMRRLWDATDLIPRRSKAILSIRRFQVSTFSRQDLRVISIVWMTSELDDSKNSWLAILFLNLSKLSMSGSYNCSGRSPPSLLSFAWTIAEGSFSPNSSIALPRLFLDISKKTQGQKNSSRKKTQANFPKKLKQISRKLNISPTRINFFFSKSS